MGHCRVAQQKREKVILRRIVVRMKSKGPLQEGMMGIRSLIFKFRLSFHHGVKQVCMWPTYQKAKRHFSSGSVCILRSPVLTKINAATQGKTNKCDLKQLVGAFVCFKSKSTLYFVYGARIFQISFWLSLQVGSVHENYKMTCPRDYKTFLHV